MIQHLVINPCGIYLVDELKAAGAVKVRNDTLWLGRHDLSQECVGAHRIAAEVGKHLRHAVTPVLCLTGAELPAPVVHLRHVVVCDEDVLVRYITSGPRCLDSRSIQSLAERGAALGNAPTTYARAPFAFPPPNSPVISRRPPAKVTHPTTRRRKAGHQILGTAVGTAVCIVGAWAVPSLAHLTDAGVDQFVRATDRTRPSSLATTPSTSTPSSPVTEGGTPTSSTATTAPPPEGASDQPALLPTLDFTCPVPGQGWVATAVPTAFQADQVGYHLWYADETGIWQYWGHFASGVETPAPLTGLAPDDALDVRMGRDFQPNGDSAPTMLTFTAPDGSC